MSLGSTRWALIGVSLCLSAVGGCAQAEPVDPAFLREYTGLRLCQGAVIRDLTTPAERDTTPGFSLHVQVTMNGTCISDFERQLSAMDCPTPLSSSGCGVQDTSRYGVTRRHTSLTIHPMSEGRYDLRFYQ